MAVLRRIERKKSGGRGMKLTGSKFLLLRAEKQSGYASLYFYFYLVSTLLQLLLSPSLFVIILSVFFYISRFNPFSLIEEEEGLFLSSLIRVIPWRPFTPFCLSFSSPFFFEFTILPFSSQIFHLSPTLYHAL